MSSGSPRRSPTTWSEGEELGSVSSKGRGASRAAVNVFKVSKDGLFINNFIATRNVAIQQRMRPSRSLVSSSSQSEFSLGDNIPLERRYLKEIRQEKKRRDQRLRQSVQRREVELNEQQDDPAVYVDFAIHHVLQSLVNLIRPTEVIKFLTSIKGTKINDEKIDPKELRPPILTKDGDVITEGLPDLFVAILENDHNQSGKEESALMLLRLEPSETMDASSRTLDDLDFDEVIIDESKLKGNTLQLHPDTPIGIRSIAGSIFRSKTDRSEMRRFRRKQRGKKGKSVPLEGPKLVPKLSVLCLIQFLNDMRIQLSGGGQVKIMASGMAIDIETVSIRSMWGFVMAVQRARGVARANNLYPSPTSHLWANLYIDDKTSVANSFQNGGLSFAEEDEENKENHPNLDDLNDVEEIIGDLGEVSATDDERFGQRVDENHVLPSKKELIIALKRILVKFDIEDITMSDMYGGLVEIYGEWIIGDNGFSKGLIDKYTMQAVGQVDPPSEIVHNLYLGTEYNASNKEELDELKIKHIVNVTEEVQNFFPESYKYHVISLRDVPTAELKPFFDAAITVIENALASGEGVLVHCQKGVSRSASVVIAFLMKSRGMTFDEALKYAVDKRPVVRPNEGFTEQLLQFEVELSGDSTDPSAEV